jgi:hypothetical protein
MGKYSKHRWHTEESLADIAKLYKTRGEFHNKDTPAYTTARLKGKEFLDSICSHMITVNYSTPQLICKKIFETILGEVCLYNTRQIVKPYELDIYFPKFKLAVEYNGIAWHKSQKAKKRDSIKKQLCIDNEIFLIVIEQINKNGNYEIEIKDQICDKLEIISKVVGISISKEDVLKIDCSTVLNDILNFKDLDHLKSKIEQCVNVKDFNEKHPAEYTFIRRTKAFHLLDGIRQKYKKYTDNMLRDICLQINDYRELKKNVNLYSILRNRNLLDEYSKHMYRVKNKYKYHTDFDLIDISKKFNILNVESLKKLDNPLWREMKKRKLQISSNLD